MPEDANTSPQVSSCGSKVGVLEGVLCLLGAAEILFYPRARALALLFVLGATWQFMRAWRGRGQPYVQVRAGHLLVRPSSSGNHDVEMRLLSGVRRGWNKTILVLTDGTKVTIEHGGFSTSAEAARFRRFVEESNGVGRA